MKKRIFYRITLHTALFAGFFVLFVNHALASGPHDVTNSFSQVSVVNSSLPVGSTQTTLQGSFFMDWSVPSCSAAGNSTPFGWYATYPAGFTYTVYRASDDVPMFPDQPFNLGSQFTIASSGSDYPCGSPTGGGPVGSNNQYQISTGQAVVPLAGLAAGDYYVAFHGSEYSGHCFDANVDCSNVDDPAEVTAFSGRPDLTTKITITGPPPCTVYVTSNMSTAWFVHGPTQNAGSGTVSSGYTSDPGTYNVTANDISGYTLNISPSSANCPSGGTASFAITYTIINSSPPPPPPPSGPPGSPVCSPSNQTITVGGTANFSASGGDGTYTWTAPGGSPGSGAGGAFSSTYNSQGSYNVTVTSASLNDSCSVTVQSNPNPPSVCSPSSQTVSDGATVTFNGSGGNGIYTWDAPSGSITGGSGPTFQTSYNTGGAGGTFIVYLSSGGQNSTCGVTVRPAGPPPNNPPLGNLDLTNCNHIAGWAGDSDTPNTPVNVELYKDGPVGVGTFVTTIPASSFRADVGSHAFDIPTPGTFVDTNAHQVYAYALDTTDGSRVQLTSSPGPIGPCLTTGTIVVTVHPDMNTSWNLNGAEPDSHVGNSYTYPIMTPGNYNLTGVALLAGFQPPTVVPSQGTNQTLAPGGTIDWDIYYTTKTLPAPTFITTDNSTCNQIWFDYLDNSSNTATTVASDGIRIYRATSSGGAKTLLALRPSESNAGPVGFFDPTNITQGGVPALVSNQTYYYYVEAYTNSPALSSFSTEMPIFVNACAGNLGNSVKNLLSVQKNGSGAFVPYNPDTTTLNDGDVLRFAITIINSGNASVTINYIDDSPTSNLVNLRNLQIDKNGNGVYNESGESASFVGDRITVSGTKATGGPNWLVEFDATLQSLTSDPNEFFKNTGDINYSDSTGTHDKIVVFGPALFSKGSAKIPTFKEVAP